MSTWDDHVRKTKATFVSMGSGAAMAALGTSNVFLRTIAKPIIDWVLTTVVDATEMGIFFLYTDWRVAGQSSSLYEAMAKNLEAQKSGTAEEKANAEKELVDAARNFIKLTR